MLVASICHHFDTLKKYMHKSHTFRVFSLFIETPEEIIKFGYIAYLWYCNKDTTTFNGIPSCATLLAYIKSMISQFVRSREQVIDEMVRVLDEIGIGG